MSEIRREFLGSGWRERFWVAARRGWRRLRYFGISRYCPLCGSHLRLFLPHGVIPRPNAVCPVCQSRDRHRLAWLWLTRETRLLQDPLTFLHLAPEPELARRLAALPNLRYLSGDLVHRAGVRLDIGRLPSPDACIDMLYCSHVLNMLPRDVRALSELLRVLKPGGLALIQVPQATAMATVEAGPRSTRAERLALFGDPDMFRRYTGSDLLERLKLIGFSAEVIRYHEHFSSRNRTRLGLIDEDLVLCRRPA